MPISMAHRFPVKMNHIFFGIHLGAEGDHNFPVDGHLPGKDVGFPFAPGACPGVGKKFLQADHFHGEVSRFFIKTDNRR